jgi:peptide/nickel transport system substrate-binding protein
MADAYALLSDTVATRTQTTGGLNAGGYTNPAFDAVLRRIAGELDVEKRKGLIAEAVTITRNDMVYLPLHQQPITWAAKKGIDLKQGPDNQLRLRLVTVN